MSQATELIAKQMAAGANIGKIWGALLYNVKDTAYGAKGDNIADDSASVNAASLACHNGGGGQVWFPQGTYKTPNLITYDDVIFVGSGASLTVNGMGFRSRVINMTLNGVYVEDSERGKTYENVMEKIINGLAVTIDCYGDSVTWGWLAGSGTQVTNTYPVTLQALLRAYYKNNNITVINRGTSGLQSDELISSTYFNPLITDNPDLVIFMCGINDAFSSGFGPVIPVAEYFKNMLTINRLCGNKPVLFMTPTPVWSYTDTVLESRVDRIYEYVQAILDMGKEYGMNTIDLYTIIRKDVTLRNVRTYDISPDLMHYTDAYYKRIGEFVFSFGLVNTDIFASNDKYFNGMDSVFNFKDVTPSYYGNTFNPQGYNIALDSAAGKTSKCYAWVFVDAPTADLLLNNVIWLLGSSANTVTVDGTVYALSNYSSLDMILWDVQTYITTLTYGLHKIDFTAVTDGGARTQFGINGITLKNVPVVMNDRDAVDRVTGSIVTNKDFNVLFNGKSELSILKTAVGNAYKQVMSLGYKKSKHYRIYAQVGFGSGIGFGRYVSKAAGGTIYDAPYAILVFELTGTTHVYARRFSNTASWLDDVQLLIAAAGGVSITGNTFVILDVIVNANDIAIYSNTTLVTTISTSFIPFGELNLYLFNYTDGATPTVNPTTKIFKVEEVPYSLPVTEYFEGEEYFDSVAGLKKVYNGTAWKTVTMT